MRCGHCKGSHETVAEVKKCYNVKEETRVPITIGANGKRGQYELIQLLLHEREMTALGPYEEVAKEMTKQQASELIRYLINDVPKSEAAASSAPLPDVPAGYYAVKSLTGNNDLDFFEVDRPVDGRWAGRTFVKRIIGGREPTAVRGSSARYALQAIVDAGINESYMLYGQTIGRCGKCHIHLTKKASRTLGLGPECAEQRGLGHEWARLNREFGGE